MDLARDASTDASDTEDTSSSGTHLSEEKAVSGFEMVDSKDSANISRISISIAPESAQLAIGPPNVIATQDLVMNRNGPTSNDERAVDNESQIQVPGSLDWSINATEVVTENLATRDDNSVALPSPIQPAQAPSLLNAGVNTAALAFSGAINLNFETQPIINTHRGDQELAQHYEKFLELSSRRNITRKVEVSGGRFGNTVLGDTFTYNVYQIFPQSSSRRNSRSGGGNQGQPLAKRPRNDEQDMRKIGHDVYINPEAVLRIGYNVYEGEQRLGQGINPRKLAIKLFQRMDLNLCERYKEEVNTMTKLSRHQNIAQFIHCGIVEKDNWGTLYIAMDLCHKATLADINVAAMEPKERKSIFLQVCHGLRHLHSRNPPVAHMDLKPTNILMSLDGKNAVVSDFGLSKEVRMNRTHSTQKTHYGTEGWMAYELIRCAQPVGGLISRANFRKADIFSLGLLGAFIMNDKQHPFCNPECPQELAFQKVNIWSKKEPNLRPLIMEQSNGQIANDLFQKMLSHDARERPDIDDVLQHCLFWDDWKKVSFILNMDEHLEKKNLQETGTLDQKLAFKEINVDLLADVMEENELLKVVTEFYSVFADCSEEKFRNAFRQELIEEETRYPDSLAKLIQRICEYRTRTIDPLDSRKSENTWKFWEKLFPKLLPLLFKIMKPAFSEEDVNVYEKLLATPDEIDISRLLNETEANAVNEEA